MSFSLVALLALLVLVTAASTAPLPPQLQLDQLDEPQLQQRRLREPVLQERRLEEPVLEEPVLDEPVLDEPAPRPWSPARRSRRRDETESQQGGRSDRLRRSRHRKRKRPSADHLLYLRSRDATCPRSLGGDEQFFCASHYPSGERACVALSSLCDGLQDCPGGEDELAVGCLFYNALSRNLEKMTDKVLQLAAHHRGRLR